MILASRNIWYMRIFIGVPRGGGVKRQWGCRLDRDNQFFYLRTTIAILILKGQRTRSLILRKPSQSVSQSINQSISCQTANNQTNY